MAKSWPSSKEKVKRAKNVYALQFSWWQKARLIKQWKEYSYIFNQYWKDPAVFGNQFLTLCVRKTQPTEKLTLIWMLTKTVVYFLLDRALTLIKIEHAANYVEKKLKLLPWITPASSLPSKRMRTTTLWGWCYVWHLDFKPLSNRVHFENSKLGRNLFLNMDGFLRELFCKPTRSRGGYLSRVLIA